MFACRKVLSLSPSWMRQSHRGGSGGGSATKQHRLQCRWVGKLRDSAHEALAGLDLQGAMVAVGGFGLGGVPETLIEALSQNDNAKDLTVISLTAGTDDRGVGQLIKTGKVRRMIAAYVGENKVFEKLYFTGKLEVELTPMGTIAQRLQCGGAGTYVVLVRVFSLRRRTVKAECSLNYRIARNSRLFLAHWSGYTLW